MKSRDLQLLSFAYYELYNAYEMKRPTKETLVKIIDDFNKGYKRKSKLNRNIKLKGNETPMDHSRIILRYL